MKRSETTKFLSQLLEKSCFSGSGKYWAREVSLDYGYATGKPRRVDYMQFIPENQCSIDTSEPIKKNSRYIYFEKEGDWINGIL